MEKFKIAGKEYEIRETRNYLSFEKLFTESGLEFNLDESGLRPKGFVKAFSCVDEDNNVVAGSSITFRKGYYILHDIAVSEKLRSLNIGERLLRITEHEIEMLGGKTIHITAKAPKFFHRYGYDYLEEKEVPDIFSCLSCKQFNVTCNPKFMMKSLHR